MRKVIAVILVVIQIAFAGFIVNRGSSIDAAENAKIREMKEYGTQYFFKLRYFDYYRDPSSDPFGKYTPMLNIGIADDGGGTYYYASYTEDSPRYARIVTDPEGESVLSGPFHTRSDGSDYFSADSAMFLYGFDFDSLDTLFDNDNYDSGWRDNGLFVIGGKVRHVLAVAYVYNDEIVFTGLSVDGEIY